MIEQPEAGDRPSASLGQYLKTVRQAQGLTLRAAEESSGVSNAYLSQLENEKIAKPSPNILYKLAELYGTSYEDLMGKAGYIVRRNEVDSPKLGLSGAALAAMEDLTPEEEHELMNYISYLRSRRSKS
jgi:transcriptional regulator with XRE-family HTH domain